MMPSSPLTRLIALFAIYCQFTTVHAAHQAQEPDLVVMAYNSYDAPLETLIFGSVDENEGRAVNGTDENIMSVGLGEHLWTIDEEGPELKRGWMFRLRLTMQKVKDEYERRGKQDFIVMIADAIDVYITESIDKATLSQLKTRFLEDFSEHKIVFSTQIYCCNPWELHQFGRRDWDTHYEKKGEIPSMYKHLNAGLFMGYASAIIDMADEMLLWYVSHLHPTRITELHISFHKLISHILVVDRYQDHHIPPSRSLPQSCSS
jgi:hypothetical protein